MQFEDDKKEDFHGCYSSVYGKSSEGDREMEGIDGDDGGGKMPADELLNKSSEDSDVNGEVEVKEEGDEEDEQESSILAVEEAIDDMKPQEWGHVCLTYESTLNCYLTFGVKGDSRQLSWLEASALSYFWTDKECNLPNGTTKEMVRIWMNVQGDVFLPPDFYWRMPASWDMVFSNTEFVDYYRRDLSDYVEMDEDEDIEEETEEEGNNGEWLGMNGVNNEGGAEGEQWDLKEVLTKDVILSPDAPQCDTDGCDLVACCIWREKNDPNNPWKNCLDCQKKDFSDENDNTGGWPSEGEESFIDTVENDTAQAMLLVSTRFPVESRARMEAAGILPEDEENDDDDADYDEESTEQSDDDDEDCVESSGRSKKKRARASSSSSSKKDKKKKRKKQPGGSEKKEKTKSNKKKVPIKLPSFDSTEFAGDRCPEQAKLNAALLLELFNSSEKAGAGSHWQGVRNSFRRDDEVMTMDKCLFMQATMPQEFFDFIGKEGFKIGDVKPEEAKALMDLLPEGWAIVDEKYPDKSSCRKRLVYLKFSIQLVRDHRRTCNDIINDPHASVEDKAFAYQVLAEMEGKSGRESHCVWYVGETVRSIEARFKGDKPYPVLLEQRFRVTHKFQIAQAPEGTDACSAKSLCLILESAVGGCIEAATNRTLALGCELEHEYVPYYRLGCINGIHAGSRPFGSMDGTMLNAWLRYNYVGNEDKPVKSVTSHHAVNDFVSRHRMAIALYCGITDATWSYEPSMRQLNKFWGHQEGRKNVQLKRGLFNPDLIPFAKERVVLGNGTVVEKGQRFPNWGEALRDEKNEIHGYNENGKGNYFVGLGETTRDNMEEECGRNESGKLNYYVGISEEHTSLLHVALELHDLVGDYTNLASLEGIAFEGNTAKKFKTLSDKYPDKLLDKLKEIHNRKKEDTVTFEFNLNLVTKAKKLGVAMRGATTPAPARRNFIRMDPIPPNSLASEAVSIDKRFDGGRVKLQRHMEVKRINEHDVEGMGVSDMKTIKQYWDEANERKFLKLEVFSIVNYRNVGPKHG